MTPSIAYAAVNLAVALGGIIGFERRWRNRPRWRPSGAHFGRMGRQRPAPRGVAARDGRRIILSIH